MGVGPREAGELTLFEFGGMLHHWNKAHANADDDGEPVEAPDYQMFLDHAAHLEMTGVGVVLH